jgi:hypothetical protein
MTTDQERARELISLIEGTNLVAEETDRHLTLTSEMGQTYVIDREGRWSCNNGRRGDTTALEMEADDPMWYAPPDPADMPDHRELRHEISPPLSDYHEDRWVEMAEERRRDDYELYHDRRQEAA